MQRAALKDHEGNIWHPDNYFHNGFLSHTPRQVTSDRARPRRADDPHRRRRAAEQRQEDVAAVGWAIEARIYAEDPQRGFLPSTGRLVRYRTPDGPGLRVDAGVYEGAEIAVHYDPMIAKLVAHGESRDAAIARLAEALDRFLIRGLSHNIGFLAAVLAKPRFAAGRLSTDFIAEEFPEGYHAGGLGEDDLPSVVAVAAVIQHILAVRAATVSGQLPGDVAVVPETWAVVIDRTPHRASVVPEERGYLVRLRETSHRVTLDWRPFAPVFRAFLDGQEMSFQIDREGVGFRLTRRGTTTRIVVMTPRAAELAALMPVKQPPDLSRFLLAPMPGLLVALAVEEGQEVKTGEELATIEAMKMENVLRAERDGRVAAIRARPGASLAVDEIILEFA